MSGKRGPRPGISLIVIVLALVVVVVVGGSAFYFIALNGPGTPSTTTHTSKSSNTTVTSTTAGLAGYKTYSGTYSYFLPIGPSGDRLGDNNTLQAYNSTQVASGTFTFFINPANYSGNGVGHGTFTITTSGFCSGSTSFQYSFKIFASTILHGNLTVGFQTPIPGNYQVALSCTGSLDGVNTATNNPGPFLSVYPNLVSVNAAPVNVQQTLSGGIVYQYSITPTN